MNYYKQIAEMLGVELGEEFKLKPSCLEKPWNSLYRFSTDGLENKYSDCSWVKCEKGAIDEILIGKNEVIKIPWEPEYGDTYCAYENEDDLVVSYNWNNYAVDYAYWKIGNCFRTKEEAETKGKEIMEAIKKEYEEE